MRWNSCLAQCPSLLKAAVRLGFLNACKIPKKIRRSVVKAPACGIFSRSSLLKIYIFVLGELLYMGLLLVVAGVGCVRREEENAVQGLCVLSDL